MPRVYYIQARKCIAVLGAPRNADPAVEFTEIMIHDLLLKAPLQLVDGYLQVLRVPGLGMELDEHKIALYRTPG